MMCFVFFFYCVFPPEDCVFLSPTYEPVLTDMRACHSKPKASPPRAEHPVLPFSNGCWSEERGLVMSMVEMKRLRGSCWRGLPSSQEPFELTGTGCFCTEYKDASYTLLKARARTHTCTVHAILTRSFLPFEFGKNKINGQNWDKCISFNMSCESVWMKWF